MIYSDLPDHSEGQEEEQVNTQEETTDIQKKEANQPLIGASRSCVWKLEGAPFLILVLDFVRKLKAWMHNNDS